MEFDVKINGYCAIRSLCRLCLNVLDMGTAFPIFNDNDCSEKSLKLRIEECVSLEMTADEELPEYVCHICVDKLNNWYEFRAIALRSLLNLKEIISDRAVRSSTEDKVVKDEIVEEKIEGLDENSSDDQKLKDECANDVSPKPEQVDTDYDEEDHKPLSIILNETPEKKDSKKKCVKKVRVRGRNPKVKPFCSECNLKFSRFSEYFAHRQDAHGETSIPDSLTGVHSESFAIYRCHICKDDFPGRGTLRFHCKTVHNVKVIQPYVCSHCERQFPSWGLCVIHERQHTGEKPYSCEVCGKENFISQASLRRHKLMHMKIFSCTDCGRDFNCDSALKAHIRCKHTNEKLFLCNVCGMSFSLATILNSHMASHSSERKYRCDICGFASKTSGNHHRHRARHKKGGEKIFNCETCGKAFETKLKLSSHQIIHRAVRPHACTVCGKAFLYNNKLEKHVLLVHAKERPYPCHLCGRKLASKFGLGIHLKTHAKTEPTETIQDHELINNITIDMS